MAYNPSLYNPYGLPQFQAPVNGLVRVESIEEANAYQIPSNSVSPPLFLGSEDSFFIKTTDANGGSTIKKYTFAEEPIPTGNTSGEFVTREYFDQQMNNILEAINGKLAVPEPTATATGQLNSQPAQVPGSIEHTVQQDVQHQSTVQAVRR